MKGQRSRLRTRIPSQGMDYKGYNIAIHEFGHNVEQTISLYDVDYYMLSGVPNTAFTEALTFVFQKRALELLGIKDETVLAIYSHMIGYPLYLSAYAFGQIIEFQLENYLNGKDFANEVSRIFKQGRLTPNVWIKQATGNDLTVDPMLEAVRKVLKD